MELDRSSSSRSADGARRRRRRRRCAATRCTPRSASCSRCSASPCTSSRMEAHFLAAVQVIVYAGAIVVLFLFVIMLLGVDRSRICGSSRSRPAPAGRHRRPRRSSALMIAAIVATRDVARCRGGIGVAGDADDDADRHDANIQHSAATCSATTCSPSSSRRCSSIVAVAGTVVLTRKRRAASARRRRVDSSCRRRSAPTPTWYLVLGAVLFGIGAVGVLVRRNPLVLFMCIELMLNAVNLCFVALSARSAHRRPDGGVLRARGRRRRGRRRSRHHRVDPPPPPRRHRRRPLELKG